MNDRDRNRYEALKRVAKFKTDNTALFPAGPAPVDAKATALFGTVVTTNTNLAAALEGRESAAAGFHAGTASQTTLRDGLLLELLEYNRAAAAIAEADETPDLMEHFRMPHGVEDAVLVARARAMKTKAASMSARFVELGFPADFATQLEARIAAFDAAGAGQDSALAQRAGITGSIGSLLKPGLKALKQLDVICRQKFRQNPTKLGEWLTASHIERQATSHGTGGGGGGGGPTEPPALPIVTVDGLSTPTQTGHAVSAGATSYRWFLKTTEDGEYAQIGEGPANFIEMTGLGNIFNFLKCIAINAAGESLESDPVQFAGGE